MGEDDVLDRKPDKDLLSSLSLSSRCSSPLRSLHTCSVALGPPPVVSIPIERGSPLPDHPSSALEFLSSEPPRGLSAPCPRPRAEISASHCMSMSCSISSCRNSIFQYHAPYECDCIWEQKRVSVCGLQHVFLPHPSISRVCVCVVCVCARAHTQACVFLCLCFFVCVFGFLCAKVCDRICKNAVMLVCFLTTVLVHDKTLAEKDMKDQADKTSKETNACFSKNEDTLSARACRAERRIPPEPFL